MITFPSKRTLDEQKPQFTLLPQEDYTLRIVNIEKRTQRKYKSEETEKVYNITFEIESLKDGSAAIDAKGVIANGRKMFFNARPDSVGFMQDGTPGKTRQLVAYATDQDILEDINLDSWDDLIEKVVNAEIIQYINQKGKKGNKIGRFLPVKKGKKVEDKVEIKDENIPVIEKDEKRQKEAGLGINEEESTQEEVVDDGEPVVDGRDLEF